MWIFDLYFTWDSGAEEVEEFAVLGVHDGSLDELHHRVAAVLKLGVAPQAERPWRQKECFSLCITSSILSSINHSHINYETSVS